MGRIGEPLSWDEPGPHHRRHRTNLSYLPRCGPRRVQVETGVVTIRVMPK